MASPTDLENLVVRLTGDNSGYQNFAKSSIQMTQSLARQIETSAGGFSRLQQNMQGIGQGFSDVAFNLMAAIGGVTAAFSLFRSSISLAATQEENEVAFGVMLRNAELGVQMVKDLQILADSTPMQATDLQEAAKMLLQYGTAGKNVLPLLRMLGDVVGGNREKLLSMSRAFGQMFATGRLLGQDKNQMISAGFNPLMALAEKASRTLGGTVPHHMARLTAEMERGNISVRDVMEAFKSATGPGGQFEGMMAKIAKTTTGLWSTMQDNISGALRMFGKAFIETMRIKDLINWVGGLAQAFQVWFSGLSAGTRSAVVGLSAFVAGVFAIGLAAGPLVSTFGFLFSPMLSSLKMAVPLLRYVPTLLMSVLNPMNVLKMAFMGIASILGVVFSPIGIAIALIAIVIGAFVKQMGGWENAWTAVKNTAMAAWVIIKAGFEAFVAWIWPILVALGGVFKAVWDAVVFGAQVVWTILTEIWTEISGFLSGIFGGISIDWGLVQAVIVTSLYLIEFTIRNFGAFAALIWTNIQLAAVIAFDGIRNAFVTVGAFAYAVFTNIGAVATMLWDNLVEVFSAGGRAIRAIFGALRAAWDAIWNFDDPVAAFTASLGEGLNNAIPRFRGLGDAGGTAFTNSFNTAAERMGGIGRSDLQNRLREQARVQGEALVGGWDEFLRRRLADAPDLWEWILDDPQAALDIDWLDELELPPIDDKMAKAAKEAQKLDAVLRGSAEAMFRIGEYVERIWSPAVVSVTPAVGGMPPRPGMPPDVPGGVPPPRPAPPGPGGVPEANPQLVRLIEILTQVEINTRPGFLGRIGLT